MFNTIGQSLWQLGELKFDFLIDRFNIAARVDKKETGIRVLEIVSLKKKRINAAEINIYHPCLEETEAANVAKRRKFISKNSGCDRELDSHTDGSTKMSEEISTFLINHEYECVPRINKIKSGRKIRRSKEDDNTQKYIQEDDKLRSLSDTGGEELLMGLEFTSIVKVEEKGELQEFVEVLKLLQKRRDIKSVDIIIGDLPEGKSGKRFSRLSDGATSRRYAIGKIDMIDSREYSLIDIEREDRALSMLLLKGKTKHDWKWIYSKLLIGLINESGKWDNEVITLIEKRGVIIKRNRHTQKDIYQKVDYIYSLLQ